MYGPTGYDPNVQALVVSKETLSGADSSTSSSSSNSSLRCSELCLVAKKREEMSFQPLRSFIIDVISATEASVDSEDAAVLRTAKMSSTYIGEWIVKKQQQQQASETS